MLTSNTIGRDWRKSLPTMLRNYRTTPHQTTGETPAMMLMNREIRTKLPSVKPSKSYDHIKVQQTDDKAKQQAKEYADRKRRAKEKDFKVGEKVLLRQPHKNKYSTQFSSDPFTIIKINGSQLEIQDKHGQTSKRNSAHVKKYYKSADREEEDEIENPTTNKLPQNELPQPSPQPEEETPPQSSQSQPRQPTPFPTPLKRRTTRIIKPPERLVLDPYRNNYS